MNSWFDPKRIAPIMWAGATTYCPLRKYGKPGMKVGIVGIGGLGHLGIMFSSKMWFKTYAFSTSKEK